MEKKHHYRAVFKSDHLGCADLEDFIEQKKPLIFTIKEVKQEINVSVAGKKINANIAYFTDKTKPLVLNATNSKVVKSFANGSPFVEDWSSILVELYIDENVKMKGDTVGGVRIRPVQPKTLSKPVFSEEKIPSVKAKGVTIEQIQTVYTISDELIKKYNEYTTG